MFSLALSLIRNHKAGLAGVFVAVLFGSAVLTACGVLIDSGLRGGYPPERYAPTSPSSSTRCRPSPPWPCVLRYPGLRR